VDQLGQVVDVYVSASRDIAAARRFCTAALVASGEPEEEVTDLARALGHVIEELLPAAFHNTEQYANNRVECDHGRLEAWLRPMRGLKTDPTARVIVRVTRSCRTCVAGTTNSAPTPGTAISGSRRPSMSSPEQPDRCTESTGILSHPEHHQRNSADPTWQDLPAPMRAYPARRLRHTPGVGAR